MPKTDSYDKSVFINCPFDSEYLPIFYATIFAVHYCGFLARSALEISDSTQTRLTTILHLVGECRYGIHDLSRTGLDRHSALPRFNMPFELGIFFGCKQFGSKRHQRKSSIVLDSEPYRYQRFISDISGQDIVAHGNDPQSALIHLRNWLRVASMRTDIAGGKAIWGQFIEFQQDLPRIAQQLQLQPDELTFLDYRRIISLWQQQKDPTRTVESL